MNPSPRTAALPARTPPAPDTFPRWPLLLIGAVLAGTVVTVAALRLSGAEVSAPDAASVDVRSLRFEDRPDGSVAVIDFASGREIDRIQGEAGFVRGTLRALARERHKRGLGPAQPFELHARADGRLTLLDPATGQRVNLEAFGPQHAGSFARLLTLDRDAPPPPASPR
jgi:putative photosynthetic complex assembly protein